MWVRNWDVGAGWGQELGDLGEDLGEEPGSVCRSGIRVWLTCMMWVLLLKMLM